jgi:hypothetical protein
MRHRNTDPRVSRDLARAARRDIIVGVPNMVHGVWRGSVWVLIALHNREHPTPGEWEAYLATARTLFDEDARRQRVRVLAISDGGGPTARQRTQAADVAAGRALPWALISGSRFARGIGTAMSWLIGGFKAFAPHELRQSLHHLEVPHGETADLVRVVRELDGPLQLATVARFDQAEQHFE